MYRRREKAFESSWAWSVWRYLHLYSCTETQWDAAYDGRLLVPGSLLSDVVRRSGLFQAYWTLNPLLGFLWSWQQSSVVSLRHLKNCKGIRNKLSDTIAIWFEDTVLPQKEKKTKQMDIWVTGWISASKTWVKAMDCKRVYLNPNHDLLSQQAAAVVRSLHWRCEPQMETCESFLTCCLLLRQITARGVDASVCKQVGIFHANYGKQWQPASNQSTHK